MARISQITHWLPDQELSNYELSLKFDNWDNERLRNKVGIHSRRISGENEFSSGLAVNAAEQLFNHFSIDRSKVDYLLLVTQTPDNLLPTTACVVHELLGLNPNAGSMDINLGCSGYVYGLGQATALVDSGQAENVLLLTADTYTKIINPDDKTLRFIFGDGSSATLVTSSGKTGKLSNFVYGTDGSGAKSLILPQGGLKDSTVDFPNTTSERRGFGESQFNLFMDGPEVFNFTLRIAQPTIDRVMAKSGLTINDFDFFVFHQANEFMILHLIEKLGLPSEKCPIMLSHTGNITSSSIPSVLSELSSTDILKPGNKLLLFGFGVGFSWGACVVEW